MPKDTPSELTFDLSKISARDMGNLNKALKTVDTEAAADVFARIVTACPWGDPADPETYLDLPFYGGWTQLTEGLNEAAKNSRKG